VPARTGCFFIGRPLITASLEFPTSMPTNEGGPTLGPRFAKRLSIGAKKPCTMPSLVGAKRRSGGNQVSNRTVGERSGVLIGELGELRMEALNGALVPSQRPSHRDLRRKSARDSAQETFNTHLIA